MSSSLSRFPFQMMTRMPRSTKLRESRTQHNHDYSLLNMGESVNIVNTSRRTSLRVFCSILYSLCLGCGCARSHCRCPWGRSCFSPSLSCPMRCYSLSHRATTCNGWMDPSFMVCHVIITRKTLSEPSHTHLHTHTFTFSYVHSHLPSKHTGSTHTLS